MVGSLFVIWPYQHRDYIEQIRDTEIVSVTDERVVKLKEYPNENLPEFNRLGETTSEGIEVLTIEKKLIKSTPYIPESIGSTENDTANMWGGVIGMIVGVFFVGGLDKLRAKKE